MPRSRRPIARNFNPPKKCGGKFCYARKSDAERVIEEKAVLQPDVELAIYRCLTCGTFHLTQTNK